MTFRKKNLSFGMVAFVDLLGFSDKVRALDTTAELKALEKQVRSVQGWFQHRPKDEYVKEEQRILAKTVLAFSDCIVVSVPVRSQLTAVQGDFDVLMAEVTDLATAQGVCAVKGIFVRGGAELGMWYRRGNTLISSAMVNAYHLEQAACVPMIALTNEFYDYLANHKHRGFYAKSSDPIRCIKRFDNLPNGKSQWLIDYLPICLGELDGDLTAEEKAEFRTASDERKDKLLSEAYHRDCVRWATCHAEAIKKAFAEATIDKVRAKYRWLAAYHDEAVGEFLAKPPPAALVGDLG